MNWHKLMACGTIVLGSAVTASACVASGEEDEQPTSEDLGADTAALQESDPDRDAESACDPRDPTRRYISRSPLRCAAIRFYCEEGEEAFFDECGCGCQRRFRLRGEPCGEVVCGPGLRCCNESCAICVGPGGSCTDHICGPAR